MAERLIFHYHDRDTPLHRLDPRSKMFAMAVLTIMVFNLPPAGLLLIMLYTAAGIIIAGMPIREYRRESLFFGMFALIIFLTRWWGSSMPLDALFGSLRFLTIVLIGMLMTETTSPDDMALALFWLLRRFSRRAAYGAAARLNLTVSFFPVIFDAVQEISEARKSRQEQRLRRPLQRMISMSTQILDVIIDRAEEISYALESRGFREDILHGELSWGRRDTLFLLLSTLCFTAATAAVLIP